MTSRNDERPGAPWLHGVASRRELLQAGEKSRAIQARLEARRYLRIYDGVYAIGHADLTVYGRRRAIVLACGPAAVLSHRAAAGAWGIRPDGAARWDVSVRTRSKIQPDAPARVHRHPTLRDDEIAQLDGIPTTTVHRTLLDLAAHVPPHHLRRAIERATELGLFDLAALRATLDAHPRRPGRRRLITLVDELHGHDDQRTRSDVEAAFLQLCADHGIPRPDANTLRAGAERDFVWAGRRLVVEVDGYAHHRSRKAFNNDRMRDRRATARGFTVIRFTASEVLADPAGVARELVHFLKLN
jgi:hypothetical protein